MHLLVIAKPARDRVMKFVRRLIGASESEERNEDEETSPVQVVDMDVAKSVTVGELRDSYCNTAWGASG
jgi:hypothetical protein